MQIMSSLEVMINYMFWVIGFYPFVQGQILSKVRVEPSRHN